MSSRTEPPGCATYCTPLLWARSMLSPKVLGLQFADGIGRADRDNSIDLYIGEDYMDVLAEGTWQKFFKVKPEVFTREEKRAWLDRMSDVALGSDAFFPFGDNIERAHKSGVQYVAQPGTSEAGDDRTGEDGSRLQ